MKNKIVAIWLAALVASLVLTDTASAYYSPRLGRFLNRDPLLEPGADLARRTTTAGAGVRFVPRDPVPRGRREENANLYQYVDSNPVCQIDLLGLKKYSYCELAKQIGGCYYALPADSSEWRIQQQGLISEEVMLCLFWKESSFDTEAKSGQGFYGLGQMNKEACDAVDLAYDLAPGTCWQRQLSNDPCDQMANSIAYLHHVLTNKKDYGHDGSLRGGLKEYGPGDAGFDEYADPILRCAECLKKYERYHWKDTGGPRGVQFCCENDAKGCFTTMNTEVDRARRKNGKK